MQNDVSKHEETEQAKEAVEHVAGEPPVDALSDEALENVAGGCQQGISVVYTWEQPLTMVLPS